jgi:hypothetical protein
LKSQALYEITIVQDNKKYVKLLIDIGNSDAFMALGIELITVLQNFERISGGCLEEKEKSLVNKFK